MDACDDDQLQKGVSVSQDLIRKRAYLSRIPSYVVPLRHSPQVVDHLKARNRVEATGRLIQEENLGARDELARHPDPSLLATADTLSDRGADQSVCLVAETESLEQSVNAGQPVPLGYGASHSMLVTGG